MENCKPWDDETASALTGPASPAPVGTPQKKGANRFRPCLTATRPKFLLRPGVCRGISTAGTTLSGPGPPMLAVAWWLGLSKFKDPFQESLRGAWGCLSGLLNSLVDEKSIKQVTNMWVKLVVGCCQLGCFGVFFSAWLYALLIWSNDRRKSFGGHKPCWKGLLRYSAGTAGTDKLFCALLCRIEPSFIRVQNTDHLFFLCWNLRWWKNSKRESLCEMAAGNPNGTLEDDEWVPVQDWQWQMRRRHPISVIVLFDMNVSHTWTYYRILIYMISLDMLLFSTWQWALNSSQLLQSDEDSIFRLSTGTGQWLRPQLAVAALGFFGWSLMVIDDHWWAFPHKSSYEVSRRAGTPKPRAGWFLPHSQEEPIKGFSDSDPKKLAAKWTLDQATLATWLPLLIGLGTAHYCRGQVLLLAEH